MRFPDPRPCTVASPETPGSSKPPLALQIDARVLAERRQAQLGAEPPEIEGHHAERQVEELAVEIDRPARGGVGAGDRDRQAAGLHPAGRQLGSAAHAHLARQAGSPHAPELEVDLLETRRLLAELGVRLDLPVETPAAERPQFARQVALGVKPGEAEARVEGEGVDVEVRLEAQLAAAGRAEPEVRHVDVPGAAVERQVESEVLRAVVAVADVEPADRRRHLDLREGLRQVGGDLRVLAGHRQPGQPLAGGDGRQRVSRPCEGDVKGDPRDAGRAVDAGEGSQAGQLAASGVGLPEIELDVVGVILRGRDPVDHHPIERQDVVVHDAQKAAPLCDHLTRVESEDRMVGIERRLDQRHGPVGVPQLEPPGAREVEHRGEVAQLGVADLELRARPRRRARRRRWRRVLGSERRQKTDGVAVFELGEAPEDLGDAQLVDREAAADQRPQLHLRFQIGDVEDHRPLRVDDLQPLDGDRARRVGHQIAERPQVPGDAGDVHLPGVGRQRPFNQTSEARALQHHRGGQHREDDRRREAQRGDAGEAGDASETRPRQWGTIVS